jgi:hypothetical protein
MLLSMQQAASSYDGMATKGKVADVCDAFGMVDTMLVGDIFAKKNKKTSRNSSDPPKEAGAKKARLASDEGVVSACPVPMPTASPDVLGSQLQGKSRFYAEYIRLSDGLVRGPLFGHGELRLSSRLEDYGDMQVYSGSSSSGEMNTAKEETYRIARSLGAPSNSWVIANVDHRAVGLLPIKIG